MEIRFTITNDHMIGNLNLNEAERQELERVIKSITMLDTIGSIAIVIGTPLDISNVYALRPNTNVYEMPNSIGEIVDATDQEGFQDQGCNGETVWREES